MEGNALDKLKEIDDETIDLIVTDPPYGYSFMGKEWDKAVVSVDVWRECLRVLKAGAFAFVMSAPRQDVLSRMIVNLQDAGFRTDFTSIYWTYASGFPKAANTFKMLQKRGNSKDELNGSYLGFQPKPAVEVVLVVMKPLSEKSFVDQALSNGKGVTWLDDCRIPFQNEKDIGDKNRFKGTKPYPIEKGWNQNNLIVNVEVGNEKGRFPANLLVSDDALNDGKITGAGITGSGTVYNKNRNTEYFPHNVYGERKIPKTEISYNDSGSYSRYFSLDSWYDNNRAQFIITPKASASERNKGLDNIPEKFIPVFDEMKSIRRNPPDKEQFAKYLREKRLEKGLSMSDIDSQLGTNTAYSWWEGRLSGVQLPTTDYYLKLKQILNLDDRYDKQMLEFIDVNKIQNVQDTKFPQVRKMFKHNHHPTVKPLKLMSYLITMGSRENDIVLDPFCGSGTTLIAAEQLNRKWIGIELNPEYAEIARKRIEPYLIQQKLL